jgi:hypothetical protein
MKSLNDEIKKLAHNLEVSKPVFKVIPDPRGFDLEVKDKVQLCILAGDPLMELIANNFREDFDKQSRTFQIDTGHMARMTCDTIEEHFLDFLQSYQGIKNPKQSKLYVFVEETLLNRQIANAEQTDLLLELYKYLILNQGEIRNNENSIHRRNVLAIFHLIKETHEARQKVNGR